MPDGMLRGTTALITGGGGAIGGAIARRFVAESAAVAVADISLDAAAAAVEAASTAVGPARRTGPMLALDLDVTSDESTEAAFAEAEERLGPVNCVVVNAGVLRPALALATSRQEWDQVIAVNLTGAFVTARVGARRMVEAGLPGRIIFTSSLFGVRGGAGNASYSASKWGMLGLMKCLAAEMAPHGITVNAVCPGQVDTPMIRTLIVERADVHGTDPEVELAQMVSAIPLGHLAPPDAIADAYVYLASALSRYTTGQELIVDGGVLVG